MVIECDINKLLEVGLTPTTYCYLYYLFKELTYPFVKSIPVSIIKKLEDDGWIKAGEVTSQFKEFIGEREDTKKVNSWIQEYCDLFPEGILNGSTPIKSAKGNCLKKMITFVNQNKKISKADILEATAIYVERKKNEGYKYMVSSQNFISKNHDSLLLTFVEDAKAREAYRERVSKEVKGEGGAFHKQI